MITIDTPFTEAELAQLMETRALGNRARIPSTLDIRVTVAFFNASLTGKQIAKIWDTNETGAIYRAARILRGIVKDGEMLKLVTVT